MTDSERYKRTPRWYSGMTDQQLLTARDGLPRESSEWEIISREIDMRARRRRDDRNGWLFIGAAALVTAALAVFVFLMSQ